MYLKIHNDKVIGTVVEKRNDGYTYVEMPKDAVWPYIKVSEKDGEWKISKDTKAEKEAALDKIRVERDKMLSACDWTILSDSPLDNKTQNKWEEYRQELRDITKGLKDPRKGVKWPKKPGDK